MIVTLLRELRLAIRVLWHDRWSSAATIVTLALAIGATAAVFGVVHAVVLKPLPYAQPDRLVTLWEYNVIRNRPQNVVAPANFLEWRDRSQSFSALAAFVGDTVSLTDGGAAEQVPLRYVTANFFDVLGVHAAAGRTFDRSDSAENAPRKAMLSWRIWQRRFGGDRSVVGRFINIDGQPMEVVGVLPAGFRLRGSDVDVWWNIRESAAQRVPRGRSWEVLGRLKPGVTVDAARSELKVIANQLTEKWPDFDTGWSVTVDPMKADLAGSARTPLLLLFAAVGIVLATGCANTTNLLLARASRRRREMAVRAALGATRWHVLRQLMVEGAVLSGLGLLAALVTARVALAGVTAFADRLGIPRMDEATLNLPVLLFAIGVMALCTLVFSLMPALQMGANAGASASLASRGMSAQRRERYTRQLLVVGQIACAVVLLIGAGLVTRSLMHLVAVDPGFDANAYTFTVSLPGAAYSEPDAKPRFYREMLEKLAGTPGVEAVGGVTVLPLGGMGTATSYVRPDVPPPAKGTEPVADVRMIVGDYFSAMRIPIVAGRGFSPAELASDAKVCVVSRAAARQVFGDEDPVGRFITVQLNGGPDQIIGVAADVHIADLQAAPRPLVYYTFARAPFSGLMSFTMRGGTDDASMQAAAISATQAIDKNVPVTDARRMSALIGDAIGQPRAAVRIVAGFALLTLVLSLVGIAALLAAIVSARLPEFAVRMALGATRGRIRGLVLGQGLWLVGIGVVTGVIAAATASSALASMLFDVTPFEPAIYIGAVAVIAALAVVAADIPARRATRTNPADALKA
jgi:putative ABC transport system permease protein